MSFSFHFRYRWRYYWIFFSLSFLFSHPFRPSSLSRTSWQARLDIFISSLVLWKYYETYFKGRWNKNGFSWSIGVDKDVERMWGYRKICRRFDSNPICNISWRKLCVRCKSNVMRKRLNLKMHLLSMKVEIGGNEVLLNVSFYAGWRNVINQHYLRWF